MNLTEEFYNLNNKLSFRCSIMKKKKFAVIAIILVLIIMLFPVRMNLKDGGSVSYKSMVYEITKIHQLVSDADSVKPYIYGFEVKILGMTVYKEINE